MEQGLRRKMHFSVLLFIVFLLLVAAIPICLQARSDARRHTATARAERVLEIRDKSSYVIRYDYVVEGKRYQGRMRRLARYYEPGQMMKVCYNPSDPHDSALVPAQRSCGTS